MNPDTHQTTRPRVDSVFRAASHPLRRRILVALMDDNPRWTDEFETLEFQPEDGTRETVAIELRHRHLPQLDEADFIDWEATSGRVTRGSRFDEIRPLLELMDEHREELPEGWF